MKKENTRMGTIRFDSGRGNSLRIKFPEVIQPKNTVSFDVYDDVISITLVNCASNLGFSTEVKNNVKNLNEFNLELGKYDLEIRTKSKGLISKSIEIDCIDFTIKFNKLSFEYELIRIDEQNNIISNTLEENLSTTFISTDIIRIQFRELNNFDLENDGFSCEDILWNINGATTNDGIPNFNTRDNNKIFQFTPTPLNRPISGSRQPNNPIQYIVSCSILGLKIEFNLEQDEKDILRQEYVDYQTNWIPERNEIHYEDEGYNTGNYNYIATRGNNRFQEIWNQLQINYQELCSQANIQSTNLTFNSCYRNPQRNRAVGSVLINSNHTIGHAMDIGITTPRTSQKWIILNNAAEQINGVNGICENGPRQVTCGASNQSHVHLAW